MSIGILLGCVSGCAVQSGKLSGVPLPEAQQAAALEREAEKEYLGAISYWKGARTVIDDKIATISLYLKEISVSYSTKGVALYEKMEGEKALDNFLMALRYDAGNEVALAYVRDRYQPRRYTSYIIQKGDTIEGIAEAVYGSPLEAYTVALFTDTSSEDDLVAGAEINLPVLDSFYSQGLIDYKRDLIVARALYKDEKFEELLPLSEKILTNHPNDEEASFLLNSSLVGLGMLLKEQEKYEEAVGTLSRVDPIYRDMEAEIQEIRRLQKEKLAKDTMRLNSELFKKGEQLYSRRKYQEALDVFREVDLGYEGVDQAISNVIDVMRMQADVHYKKGVKFFVNDKLDAAIKEWEMALRFNPEHEKAAHYIAKARELLEKAEAIK